MNLEKIYQQTILEYSNRRDLKKEMEAFLLPYIVV